LFAAEHNLIVLNTFFKLPPRRLHTWKSPRDNGEDIILRNQIGYILVNARYRKTAARVKIYPGTDIQSDHNLLVGEYKTRYKKIQRKIPKKQEIRKLKDRIAKDKISKAPNENCREIEEKARNTEEKIRSLNRVVEKIKDRFLKNEGRQN